MNLEEKIRAQLDEQKIAYKIKAWDLKKICKPALVKM
jgi:hypothetical protein